jgi:phosphomannomutase
MLISIYKNWPNDTYVEHSPILNIYVAGKYEGGWAFVSPSGTEDVVRMHAEASSQQSADALAQGVCVQVYHLVGGISPKP